MDTGGQSGNHSSILPSFPRCPKKTPPLPRTPLRRALVLCSRAPRALRCHPRGLREATGSSLGVRLPQPAAPTPLPWGPAPRPAPRGGPASLRPRGLTLPARRSSSSIAAGWCGGASPTPAPRAGRTAPSSQPAGSWRWRPSSARRLSAGR